MNRDRRAALHGLMAATLAPLAAGCASPSNAPVDAARVSAPEGRLRDYMLMRAALDERLVIGFLSGQYHAVVDEELTPVFGVLSATFSRYRARPEGGYTAVSFEHAYFTDVDSGAVMSEWRNPLTGRVGPVPVWTSQPSRRVLTPSMAFESLRPPAPGMSSEHRLISAEQRPDELVLVERVRFVAKPPPPARPTRYAELVTMRASLAALRDPQARRVPCTTGWASVSSWRPWMQMGDQVGHLLGSGAGRYGAELPGLPEVWLQATQRLRPDLLQDPGRVLDPVFNG